MSRTSKPFSICAVVVDCLGATAQFALTVAAALAIYAAQPTVLQAQASPALHLAVQIFWCAAGAMVINMIALLRAKDPGRTIPTLVAYLLCAIGIFAAQISVKSKGSPLDDTYWSAACVLGGLAFVVLLAWPVVRRISGR